MQIALYSLTLTCLNEISQTEFFQCFRNTQMCFVSNITGLSSHDKLIVYQHCFRLWLGADQATSFINQTNKLSTNVNLRRQPQFVNPFLICRASLADSLARWSQRSMRHPFFFLLLKMRKRNTGNGLSFDGLFHFLITASLRGRGHMDRWAFLFSNNCLATQ